MSENKCWPEKCVWPEPIWNGEGEYVETAPEFLDEAELDEESRELLEIREYFDEQVELGRLNPDYTLNEDYEEYDESWQPEKGDDYWDDEFFLDAWEEVNWGQFQYLNAIAKKGESARLHLGLIAQHVMLVFEKHGLDACDYGILCHEEYEATEDSEAIDLWMVRYAEAQAMEACCMRRKNARLKKHITDLEERLEALELLLKS